jgi:hypothetical protein
MCRLRVNGLRCCYDADAAFAFYADSFGNVFALRGNFFAATRVKSR